MKRTSYWSVPGLVCSAAALLVSAAVVHGQGEEAVAVGKKLISKQAEDICRYAHAKSTYSYKEHEYVGHNKTKDGYHELTYKFTVKGNLKTQTMNMAFYFKDNGQFEFLRVKEYTTIYEPFKRLSAAYLKQLRDEMAKRPAIAGDTEALRVIDGADAQKLCEMHLKQAQSRK